QPDGVREALAEGTGRDLHAGRVRVLRVSRRAAAPLAELLQVVERQVVPGEMEEAVEQHAAVPSGEHEAVTIGPPPVRRVVPQVAGPEDVGHRGRTEWQPGMARARLLDGVDGERSDRIDALVRAGTGSRHHNLQRFVPSGRT